MKYEHECRVALAAVSAACRMTRRLQTDLVISETKSKSDASPVTIADYAVQALVVSKLRNEFPNDKFIAEESSKALYEDENLRYQVIKATSLTEEQVFSSIECCNYDYDNNNNNDNSKQRIWIMDPIDGTKGFIAMRQYCIALALLYDNDIQLGILGCPRLSISSILDDKQQPEQQGVIFHAIKNHGTYMILDHLKDIEKNQQRIYVSDVIDPIWATFCESVETGHSSHELSARVASILGVSTPPIRMDSQAKYGCMARGDASIFLRFPRPGYIENVWDSAPASIIIEEAGGKVTDGRGRKLNFTLGRKMDNDDGIVATNGIIHDAVIDAVQQAIREQREGRL